MNKKNVPPLPPPYLQMLLIVPLSRNKQLQLHSNPSISFSFCDYYVDFRIYRYMSTHIYKCVIWSRYTTTPQTWRFLSVEKNLRNPILVGKYRERERERESTKEKTETVYIYIEKICTVNLNDMWRRNENLLHSGTCLFFFFWK